LIDCGRNLDHIRIANFLKYACLPNKVPTKSNSVE
jgi:hypothetical protein